MARLQNPESQACYAGYMVKFVCYTLRIVADAEARMIAQESSDKNEDNDKNKDNNENEGNHENKNKDNNENEGNDKNKNNDEYEDEDEEEEEDEDEEEDKDKENTGSGDNSKDNILESNENRPTTHQGCSQKENDLMKDARVLFHWTSRQKELAVALWQMLDSNTDNNDTNNNAQHEAQLEVLLNSNRRQAV
jgi:hypothetical protein